MTLYVGSNKIKDVSMHGVYVGSQNTNCLTYVPKNINLTLSNNTLTLKAGSKVYVPNGKNADGSLKFDEVVVASDKATKLSSSTRSTSYIVIYSETRAWATGTGIDYFLSNIYSGTTQPTVSGNNNLWYDTANNKMMSTSNAGANWVESRMSLPVCIATGAKSAVTSIDQIFDWCGFIGSTAFVLPGVKGLIPNGFKADGTYKSVEFTVDNVLTTTRTWDVVASFVQKLFIHDAGKSLGIQNYQTESNSMPTVNNWTVWYNPKENIQRRNDSGNTLTDISQWAVDTTTRYIGEIPGDGTSKIIGLTPATVKPSTTTIPINAIYNGSQLVYQYNSYNPNQVIVNITNGQTATVTLKKGVYQLYAAGGGGAYSSWGAGGYVWARGGCSGGAVEGLFYLSEPKTFVCKAGTLTGGTAGTSPNSTTITVDGTAILTCVSGKNGYDSQNGGTGGTASFTNALGSVSCVATTGLNKGSLGSYNGSPSVSSKKWGAGGNAPSGEYTYGGIIIQYIRYEV